MLKHGPGVGVIAACKLAFDLSSPVFWGEPLHERMLLT